jgi:hypothetical protein
MTPYWPIDFIYSRRKSYSQCFSWQPRILKLYWVHHCQKQNSDAFIVPLSMDFISYWQYLLLKISIFYHWNNDFTLHSFRPSLIILILRHYTALTLLYSHYATSCLRQPRHLRLQLPQNATHALPPQSNWLAILLISPLLYRRLWFDAIIFFIAIMLTYSASIVVAAFSTHRLLCSTHGDLSRIVYMLLCYTMPLPPFPYVIRLWCRYCLYAMDARDIILPYASFFFAYILSSFRILIYTLSWYLFRLFDYYSIRAIISPETLRAPSLQQQLTEMLPAYFHAPLHLTYRDYTIHSSRYHLPHATPQPSACRTTIPAKALRMFSMHFIQPIGWITDITMIHFWLYRRSPIRTRHNNSHSKTGLNIYFISMTPLMMISSDTTTEIAW